MSLFLFLLVSGVGCGFCLWLFLDFSVYLFNYYGTITEIFINVQTSESWFVCIVKVFPANFDDKISETLISVPFLFLKSLVIRIYILTQKRFYT